MNHIILTFFGLLVIIASCQNNSPSINGKLKQPIIKEIRTDTSHKGTCFRNIRAISRQLKLPSLEDGFDSLQIRIFFDYSLAIKKHLFVIKRTDKKWQGRLYEITVDYIDTLDYDIVERYNSNEIEPKLGWQHFIDELSKLKFRDIVDTLSHGTDGTSICIETATNDSYTYYDYWEPAYTKDTNTHSFNMYKIIELLKREFEFQPLGG